ncbi:hypothetical protein Syun_016827 [Stephania yunnanensis]|uniref:Uncharacterized protein n=1 Tax=Stephania yunnanensis TaxID=152371 RepID=A0AAP0J6R4_9MAGN
MISSQTSSFINSNVLLSILSAISSYIVVQQSPLIFSILPSAIFSHLASQRSLPILILDNHPTQGLDILSFAFSLLLQLATYWS